MPNPHRATAENYLAEDESGRIAHRDDDIVHAVMSVSHNLEALTHAVLAGTDALTDKLDEALGRISDAVDS